MALTATIDSGGTSVPNFVNHGRNVESYVVVPSMAPTGDPCILVGLGVSQPSPHLVGLRPGLHSYPSRAGDRLGEECHSDTCLVLSASTAETRRDPVVPGLAGLLMAYCQGTAGKNQRRPSAAREV